MKKLITFLLLLISSPVIASNFMYIKCGNSVTCTPTSRNNYCVMDGNQSQLFTLPMMIEPLKDSAYFGLIQTVINDGVAICWYSNRKTGSEKIEFPVRILPKYEKVHPFYDKGNWKGDERYYYCEGVNCLMYRQD